MQVHGVYTCIYVHMHKCAAIVLFILMNQVMLLWSRTYYLSYHLINMLNPVYIYVCSITWVSWQLYSLGVDMYMDPLIRYGMRIWMPKRRWRRHFQHTTYLRILYILIFDFIELLYSNLYRHFNFAKCLIQDLLLGSTPEITVTLQNIHWYDATQFSPDIIFVLYFT